MEHEDSESVSAPGTVHCPFNEQLGSPLSMIPLDLELPYVIPGRVNLPSYKSMEPNLDISLRDILFNMHLFESETELCSNWVEFDKQFLGLGTKPQSYQSNVPEDRRIRFICGLDMRERVALSTKYWDKMGSDTHTLDIALVMGVKPLKIVLGKECRYIPENLLTDQWYWASVMREVVFESLWYAHVSHDLCDTQFFLTFINAYFSRIVFVDGCVTIEAGVDAVEVAREKLAGRRDGLSADDLEEVGVLWERLAHDPLEETQREGGTLPNYYEVEFNTESRSRLYSFILSAILVAANMPLDSGSSIASEDLQSAEAGSKSGQEHEQSIEDEAEVEFQEGTDGDNASGESVHDELSEISDEDIPESEPESELLWIDYRQLLMDHQVKIQLATAGEMDSLVQRVVDEATRKK